MKYLYVFLFFLLLVKLSGQSSQELFCTNIFEISARVLKEKNIEYCDCRYKNNNFYYDIFWTDKSILEIRFLKEPLLTTFYYNNNTPLSSPYVEVRPFETIEAFQRDIILFHVEIRKVFIVKEYEKRH